MLCIFCSFVVCLVAFIAILIYFRLEVIIGNDPVVSASFVAVFLPISGRQRGAEEKTEGFYGR